MMSMGGSRAAERNEVTFVDQKDFVCAFVELGLAKVSGDSLSSWARDCNFGLNSHLSE